MRRHDQCIEFKEKHTWLHANKPNIGEVWQTIIGQEESIECFHQPKCTRWGPWEQVSNV